uniref:hypothetical protein n=1 Tax=Streptomyces sp. GbtcB6 TaxID=2824751 RepID=UPI001C30B6F6
GQFGGAQFLRGQGVRLRVAQRQGPHPGRRELLPGPRGVRLGPAVDGSFQPLVEPVVRIKMGGFF